MMRVRQPTLILFPIVVLVLVLAVAAHSASAALPAEASTSGVPAVAGTTGETPGYQLIAPGLLARTLFATSEAGPIATEMVDLLVGPGQSARLPAIGFAALIDIEAGSAVLSLDGKVVAIKPGSAVGVGQGQTIEIDNRRESRNFLARLVKLSTKGD